MEIVKKKVVKSNVYFTDILEIFEYDETTFGEKAALSFFDDLLTTVRNLESQYYLHPECRHLITKSKKYRNIILGSYLIIYKITADRIEVLRAFHSSCSPKTIQKSKKITIE